MYGFRTITDAITQIGEHAPQGKYVFQDMRGNETTLLYKDLERVTAARAATLQHLGLKKGDHFGLIVIEPEAFVVTFLSAMRLGAVPVPLYPPLSMGNLDAYFDRTKKILSTAQATHLIGSKALKNVLFSLVDHVATLKAFIDVNDLVDDHEIPQFAEILPDDIAMLQYTSGSTSDPKGVMVTHAGLIANTTGLIYDGLGMHGVNDVAVAWLPLYHDMGLIGHVLSTMVTGMSSVLIPTMRFLRRPSMWMEAIHNHRGTISFAPNFAYALATRRARPEQLQRWDLSCMQVFGCGAEPIHAQTVEAFTALFHEHCDLPKTALRSAYGMAEATLAMSFQPPGHELTALTVDAERFQDTGAVVKSKDANNSFTHVSCGKPFTDHKIAIFDESNQRLAEGQEGEICFFGPSVSPGYFENPEATAEVFRDGWLKTGDLGYLYDGEVYVTGRLKDLIILNGRNLHPQSIEWVVAEIEGVRKGNVVAFSRPGANSEELVIALETRSDQHDRLREEIERSVREALSVTSSDIICLKPGTLPKTSSGKLQRRKTRKQYLLGTLGQEGSRTPGSAAAKMTLAKHMARSVWSRAKHKASDVLNR